MRKKKERADLTQELGEKGIPMPPWLCPISGKSTPTPINGFVYWPAPVPGGEATRRMLMKDSYAADSERSWRAERRA